MLLLTSGEKVILSEQAKDEQGRRGVLTLTNTRIVFEDSSGDHPATLIDWRLTAFQSVHVDQPRFGLPRLSIEATTGQSHQYRVNDAAAWGDAIRQAHMGMSHAQPVGVKQTSGSAPPVPPAVFLHCTHCGSLVKPSDAGAALRCPSCGAHL